jgi:hypothetical protein
VMTVALMQSARRWRAEWVPGLARSLLVALILSWAGSMSPAAAQTTASPDGTVVTINVPIDVILMGADVVSGADRRRITNLAKMAELIWNPGLQGLKFRDCLTFKIKVDIEVHPDAGRTFREPMPHQIDWYDDPAADVFVLDPGEDDHTKDSPNPYKDFTSGQWSDLDIGEFVHELGHLLGLGDDYIRVPDDSPKGWHAVDKPGREGTIMAKRVEGRWGTRPGRIDQNIVDRLDALVDQTGFEWPYCWEGSWQTEARHFEVVEDVVGLEPGHRQLHHEGTLEARFRFGVSKDGAIVGTGTAKVSRNAATTLHKPLEDPARHGSISSGEECTYSYDPAEAEGPIQVIGQKQGEDFWLLLNTISAMIDLRITTDCIRWDPINGVRPWGEGTYTLPTPLAGLVPTTQTNPVSSGFSIPARDGASEALEGFDASGAGWKARFTTLSEHRTRVEIRKLRASQ